MMKTILADDEQISLRMLKKLIAWDQLGLTYCGSARDGNALLDMILRVKPDLVITDIMMPGIDGLQVIAKVTEAGLSPDFLITSAYANFTYAKRAMRLGVKDFLEKPIDREELNTAIRNILEGRSEHAAAGEMGQSQVSAIIQTAKTYIDEHFAEKLTLETVADYIYLSPNYLSGLFHKEMGMSFVEYISDVRLKKAEKYLMDPRFSVSDVAAMVGYRDSGYFSNVFSKRYGMTPTAWRKR